jgi:hypothetical protein
MQSMWNNGFCEPQCNNVRCGYNDCTASQITQQCLIASDLSGVSYSTPPNHLDATHQGRGAVPYPVSLTLDFDPARLRIDDDINSMVSRRCSEEGIPLILSSIPNTSIYSSFCTSTGAPWVGHLHLQLVRRTSPLNPVRGRSELHALALTRGRGLRRHARAPAWAQELCPGCATYTGDLDFQLLEDFNYYYFPFDNQARRPAANAYTYTSVTP